jgi:hypothetical protein
VNLNIFREVARDVKRALLGENWHLAAWFSQATLERGRGLRVLVEHDYTTQYTTLETF